MVDKLKFIQWLIVKNRIETLYNCEEIERCHPCRLDEYEEEKAYI